MTLTQRRLTRWLAPLAVLALVLSIAGVRASTAGAAPSLPRIGAASLLAKVAQTKVDTLSGVIRTDTDLGLPALPDTGGALSPQALLAGRHTLRVYLDGPQRQRVDLLGTLAETNLVHSGSDVWQWSSSTDKVSHTRLPAPSGERSAAPAGTPQALARQLIAAVDPTTQVSVGTAATVAGRSAYDLRLAPKPGASLVKRADLYVDATTGLPLRVTVLAKGATKPAIDVGFVSIRLDKPAARVFRFAAPAGAKVTQLSPPAAPSGHPAMLPVVLGAGWTSVVEIRGAGVMDSDQLTMLLRGAATVTGRFGSGRVITTRLLTVLLTDDGRVFAGAVTKNALIEAAGSAGRG